MINLNLVLNMKAKARKSGNREKKTLVRRRSEKRLPRRKDSRHHSSSSKPEKKKRYPDGCHPNSRKQWWKPGQSGNPKGRPKKENSITSLMKQYLGEIADTRTGKTHAVLAAEALIAGLIDLNPTAVKEVLGRLEGPVVQKIDVKGSSSVELSMGDVVRELTKKYQQELKKKPRKRKRKRRK